MKKYLFVSDNIRKAVSYVCMDRRAASQIEPCNIQRKNTGGNVSGCSACSACSACSSNRKLTGKSLFGRFYGFSCFRLFDRFGKHAVRTLAAAVLFSTAAAWNLSAAVLDDAVYRACPDDARVTALAGAFTAAADDANALFHNPAGLSKIQEAVTEIQFDCRDTIPTSVLTGNEIHYCAAEPIITPRIVYAAPNWGIAMYSGFYGRIPESADSEGSDNTEFDVYRKNVLETAFSFDSENFSIGFGFKSAKGQKLKDGPLTLSKDPARNELMAELISQVFLGEYGSPPNGSENGTSADAEHANEELLLSAGLLADFNVFSAGLYHDRLVDLIELSNDGALMGYEELMTYLDAGIAFRSRWYDDARNTNMTRILFSADIDNIGFGLLEEHKALLEQPPDDISQIHDIRRLQLGVEAGLHFSETTSISLRAGYSEPVLHLKDLLYGFSSADKGTLTMGAGLDLFFASMDVSLQAPPKALSLLFDPQYDYGVKPLQGRVTIGASF